VSLAAPRPPIDKDREGEGVEAVLPPITLNVR
jgi:hypothetical protein